MSAVRQAVILARGLGKRMRAPGAALDERTAAVAETGIKALIPIDRPFLDYVLSDLADAGIDQVILVIGPEHGALRSYYRSLVTTRISIEFAVQELARGTADAVLAVEPLVAQAPFLVLNSDNRYPPTAFRALCQLGVPGLIGFRSSGLRTGNIPPERIARFAAISVDATGHLARIIEKPDALQLSGVGDDPLISMNCWCFDSAIFSACRQVAPSPRQELELPDAVAILIARGHKLRVIENREAVLDLSSRDDISAVRRLLAGYPVRL